jgi:acetyl esterase/lipase
MRLERQCSKSTAAQFSKETNGNSERNYLMNVTRLVVLACATLVCANADPQSDNGSLPPAQVPAKTLPVPRDVSPEMQRIIAAPRNPSWNVLWRTGEEWRAAANTQAAKTVQTLPAMRERLHVTTQPGTMGGVRIFTVASDTIPPEHRNKLLLHVHGGCYVFYPGESGTSEAILMAGLGHFNVVSVDYRMPPEGYFPAALDDAMNVYKEALKTHDPKDIAVFGTSAGGALVLEMMLRAKQMGLPMPGAIAPGTPMADVTKTGDTFYTNEMVDNVLVSRSGFCDAATVVYAHGHDLKDPLLSPVYGDMHGFPPAILTTGTRDLLLSNTVRVHRKLRQAGIDAQLEVFEGQSHAQYQFDDRAPETKEAFGEITAFFDKHLGH